MKQQSGGSEFAGMSAGEELLVRARRESLALSKALREAPFTAATAKQLHAYVPWADEAVKAWTEVQRLSEEQLRQRVDDLMRTPRSCYVTTGTYGRVARRGAGGGS